MRIPTHVVIDTEDGWTWWHDRNGHLFVEATAVEWADTLNSERRRVDESLRHIVKRQRTGFIVAEVTPVMSPELLTAVIADGPEVAAIEAAGITYEYDPEHPLDEIRGSVE